MFAQTPGRAFFVSCLAVVALVGAAWPGPADSAAAQSAPETPNWRAIVDKFAQDHFNNPAWGYSHSRRDYELARELAAADHVALDDDILYAAAYLHDMAAFEPWEVGGRSCGPGRGYRGYNFEKHRLPDEED